MDDYRPEKGFVAGFVAGIVLWGLILAVTFLSAEIYRFFNATESLLALVGAR